MQSKRFGARFAALLLIAATFVGVSALTEPALAVSVTDPGALISLSPSRILDTRANQHAGVHPGGTPISGQVAAGQTLDVQVAGVGGVPSTGAGSVVLNVAVTNPTGSGFVRVFPGDVTSPGPNTSNLNFTPGLTIADLVTVRLGSNGDVKIYIGGSGAVDVVADVSGYYVGGTPSAPGTMDPLATPFRAVDTRYPTDVPVQVNSPRNLVLAGQGGLPAASSISAVVLSVAVTAPTASGYLTLYPGSSSIPNAANLNFTAGQTIANAVTVQVGHPAGDVNVAVRGANNLSADVVIDVTGYYLAGTATDPGTFVSLPPARILETRSDYGLTGVSSPGITAGSPLDLVVAGHGGVPMTGAGAILMNTAMIQPSVQGYLAAYPGDSGVPNASNINFSSGDIISNLVSVKLGATNGDAKLLYASSPTTGVGNLAADVAGYFRQGDAPPTPAPGPVLGLSAGGVNAGEVDVSWTNPSYATGVTICRSKTNFAMTPSNCAANGGTVFNAPTGATGLRDYFLMWSTTYYYAAWATNSVGTSTAATATGTTLSNANSRQNPATNNQPNGLGYCDYSSTAISQSCANGAAADFNAARAQDGLGPMALPSNFGALSTQQQLFVLTNIDRVDHGVAPLDGLSAALTNQAAVSGYGQDPAFPAGTLQGGSNWSSTVNPFWTQFLWMYDDGLNSPNSDCTPSAPGGCWGHRLNVIGPYNAQTSMGDSVSSSAGTGALYIGSDSRWTDFTLTWASERPYFPKGCPENP